MGVYLENPFRRRGRKRRSSSRRRGRSRGRSRRRRNPFAAAPKRRGRRRGRRSGGRRRSSSRRRRNPSAIGGGARGVTGQVMKAIPIGVGMVAGQFVDGLLMHPKIAQGKWSNIREPFRRAIIGAVGGIVLHKFGGPVRRYAGAFAVANLALALASLKPALGYTAASAVSNALPGSKPLSDYMLGDTLPPHGTLGQPAGMLYDYSLQLT